MPAQDRKEGVRGLTNAAPAHRADIAERGARHLRVAARAKISRAGHRCRRSPFEGIALIAEALAPRCKAFGMTVIGFSSTQREVAGIDRMYLRNELIAHAGELDYLVLLVPYAENTRLLVDARVFAAMKPGSYLVNLARGGVVDEDALIAALEAGKLAGAALDVFQHEPLPADHPLWTAKNVIITPHQGGFCDVYPKLALPTIEHNMACFLRGDFDGMVNVVRR